MGSIHPLPICPRGIHRELALCLCVSLYVAHSGYPVNGAIDTLPVLSQAVPRSLLLLNLALLFNFRVCQNCLPARLIMPRGHRLWVLPISQRFTLEMTHSTQFFFNLMPFDYTKSHFHLGRFQGLNHSWRKKPVACS